MIDEVFKILDARGLMDWAAIEYSLKEMGIFPLAPSSSLVSEFAEKQLVKCSLDDPALGFIADLISDSPVSRADAAQKVGLVCELVGCQPDVAVLKWRAAQLEWTLQNMEDDPIYACMQLSEFWSRWGWPKDAPNSMLHSGSDETWVSQRQGDIQPIVREHAAWVAAEFARLQ